MEPIKAIPQPNPLAATPAKPPASMDDLPPWLEIAAERPAAAPAAANRVSPRRVPAGGRAVAGEFEKVHWSVVALTLFTAACVLFGSHGVDGSQPRELLPIMITRVVP